MTKTNRGTNVELRTVSYVFRRRLICFQASVDGLYRCGAFAWLSRSSSNRLKIQQISRVIKNVYVFAGLHTDESGYGTDMRIEYRTKTINDVMQCEK